MAGNAAASGAKPWWKRPIPLACAAIALVIVVLVIALPAGLVNRGGSSNNGSSGSSNSTASSTASGSMPTPTLYGGCGQTQPTGFSNDFTNQNLASGGYTRNYSINVPPAYNDDLTKQWPLILDFHGNSRTGTNQYNNSMFYTYDGGLDYLVVYPEGVNQSWQGPSYAVEGVDDLKFTSDLIAHLNKTYCIDSNRFYVSGKSNGGGFADTLACSDNGDIFAAYAMASAALYTDTSEGNCTKRRAILESHGLEDTTIPYDPTGPGNGGALPSVRSWVNWWSVRDGCASSDKASTQKEDGYEIDSYSCGDDNDVVQHYAVTDLQHCWPSSRGDNFDSVNSTSGKCDDRSLDFTPVVLEWFGNWTLENAPSN